MLDSGFYNMDCMEALKDYPDKYFDLAIVDPPYGIGAENFKNASGYHGKESAAVKAKNRLNQGSGKLKNRALNKSDCSWDCEPPSKEYFDELFRVSKHQIIWGGNYFDLPPTRGIIVWDKLLRPSTYTGDYRMGQITSMGKFQSGGACVDFL